MSDATSSSSFELRETDLLFDYQGHLNATRSHIYGHLKLPLPASQLLPNSNWTSDDKGAFFHSLAIRSRLRPDLIAQDIGKSIGDVCLYLSLLHDASLENGPLVKRTDFDPALEVSDAWIAYEEGISSAIVVLDSDLSHQATSALRSDARAQKRSSRGPKPPTRDRGGEKARKAAHKRKIFELEAEWAADDALESLNPTHLRALDAFLRTREEEDEARLKAEAAAASRGTTPAQSAAGDEDGGDGEDGNGEMVDDLSPRSRRRIRNRLYMRRKRAEVAGEVADQDPTRHKRGRKLKPRIADVLAGLSGPNTNEKIDVEMRLLDAEVDLKGKAKLAGARHPNPSGLTRFYKVQKGFTDAGVDAEVLRERSMDLLNLGAVGRAMNIQLDTISGSVLSLLQASLVQYITLLIKLSILSRHEEVKLKGRTKAWRLSDTRAVVRSNVEWAVDMLGGLRLPSSLAKETPSEVAVEGEDEDDWGDEESPVTKDLTEPPIPHLPHLGYSFNAFSSPQRVEEVDDYLPEEDDTPALLDELDEEEDLDLEDLAVAEEAEDGLWAWGSALHLDAELTSDFLDDEE